MLPGVYSIAQKSMVNASNFCEIKPKSHNYEITLVLYMDPTTYGLPEINKSKHVVSPHYAL